MDQGSQSHALLAVLRVAARHADLLDQEAFAELASALGELAAGGRVTVLVPEGPLRLRIHAVSPGPEPLIGFGERLPGDEGEWHTLFVEQRAVFCDDMRRGNEVERSAAQREVDTLSYAAFPCRVSGPGAAPSSTRGMGQSPALPGGAPSSTRVVALLVLTFPEVGGARRVASEPLQEVADALAPALERAARFAREHRLAMILETSDDAMLAWDREGNVTDANRAAVGLTGRSRLELLGTPITDLLDPPPHPGSGERLSLLARAPALGSTTRVRRVPVAATVTAVEHDALVAAHALLRDLSAVVEAERQAAARLARIHELEQEHRTLLDNAPLIIFRLDPGSLELVYLNRHAERLLGVPTAEALRTPGFLRTAHADPAAFDAAVARAAEGGRSLAYEARLKRADGDPIMVLGSVYPLLAEGGGVAAIEGVLADVSAEHAARTRLVQADRLSTLGTLAAGVAHEINNPAAFILLGLDLFERLLFGPGVTLDAAAAAAASSTLRELRDSIRRIVDIARDLRLFASPPAPEGVRRTIVDVNRTVASALSLTRGQILERAQIESHLEEVPPVLMDDGQLGQVLVNLLVNAVQAIPRSYAADHRITVATRSAEHAVEIEVEDTGVGIPEANLARIFEPFFTTRSPDVGTGLGLSISREIVERAGGTLRVLSPVTMGSQATPNPDGGSAPKPLGGSRFIIRLPAAGHREVALAPDSPLPTSGPPPARVLLVDDEPALARALAEEIGRRHEVVVAGSAEAALARLAAEPFDVVLCDLRMPGMSGEALYTRVRAEDPDQAEGFVFMTGVGFGGEVERFLGASGRPVLEKPFSAAKTLETIARVRQRRAIA
jgi:PAS domain S-box-containing protein